MLPVGTILHGSYRIDAYLASGGFGNTYSATNQFGEKVAIKEFFMRGVAQRMEDSTKVSITNPDNQATFQQQLEKFRKEARRLHNINSLHIVHVSDLFDENGTSYYAMNFIDGESLLQRQKRLDKPMDEESVLNYFRQILEALRTIHEHGFYHLDLKPANIMLDKDGNIFLIDFGSSKQVNAQGGATMSTSISYTAGYAPREQMEQNAAKFGPWTDFYALGAATYSLLTNKRPPMPSDIDEDGTEDKHLALPMPASVSQKTQAMVRWLLSTNRTNRPQTTEDIIHFTESYKEDEVEVVVPANEETQVIGRHPKEDGKQPSHENKNRKPLVVNGRRLSRRKLKSFAMWCICIVCLVALAVFGYFLKNQSKANAEAVSAIAEKNNGQTIETQETAKIYNVMNHRFKNSQGLTFTYTGQMKNNEPNGIGTGKYANGTYSGPYSNGLRHGEDGTFKTSDGKNSYKGSFYNDKYNRGTLTLNTGVSFIGTFSNGQPFNGTWYNADGTYNSEVKNGK